MHGTTSCDVDEDLSLCLDSSLVIGWRSSDRYCGADQLRHWYVRATDLSQCCSGWTLLRSQCTLFFNGVLIPQGEMESEEIFAHFKV